MKSAVRYGIGGQASTAVAGYTKNRLVGSNRFQTVQFVACEFFGPTAYVGVATAYNWPDALAGGAPMATLNGPLLLTDGAMAGVPPATGYVLDEHGPSVSTALAFGGAGVVIPAAADAVGAAISGPAGFETADNPHDVGVQPGTAPAVRAVQPVAQVTRLPTKVVDGYEAGTSK